MSLDWKTRERGTVHYVASTTPGHDIARVHRSNNKKKWWWAYYSPADGGPSTEWGDDEPSLDSAKNRCEIAATRDKRR